MKEDDKRFEQIAEDKLDTVHPDAEGFAEKVTPISPEGLFFFKCANCGNTHFRHAGYMKGMFPFMKPQGKKEVNVFDYEVNVCTKCKNSFIWVDEQMYDVTEQIDLKAWEKAEKELHRMTGPGGQC